MALQSQATGGQVILIRASNLRSYFELLKSCEAKARVESKDPYLGLIGSVADGPSADSIATEVASYNLSGRGADRRWLMGAASLEALDEWLLYAPIGLENDALAQLHSAGKIREEHEWIDGRESVVFISSGPIQELAQFLPQFASASRHSDIDPPWRPRVELEIWRQGYTWEQDVAAAAVGPFLDGEVGFHLATRNGKPAITWRLISSGGALCQ